jgi:predicted NBD/HSP70 family sugar kinase
VTNRDAAPPDRHELVRRANIEHVLRAIGDQGPLSRRELVTSTGLSKPTVLSIISALEDEGLIRGISMPSAGVGRTPTFYEHNPGAAHVVGIDLGGTTVTAAVANLAGEILAEIEERTSTAGGDAVVRQLATISREVARRGGARWGSVEAVSVGSPGVITTSGTLDLASNVAGLASTPLGRDLRRALRTPVNVDNDVNMAALGELRVGVAQKCSTFALLAIGTGVGLGLVIDGRVARGARGGAGEIAFFPIGGDPTTPDARERGTLEVAISGSGVQRMLVEELARHRSATLTRASTARDVFVAAGVGDAAAIAVVERQSEILAHALLALASLIDPEMVVLGGGIGSNPYLLEPVRAALDVVAPWPVRVETSALGPRAGVVGAVHHALASLPQIESHRVSARMQETS